MDIELEKNIKDRWFRLYQNDINLYNEKRNFEVII